MWESALYPFLFLFLCNLPHTVGTSLVDRYMTGTNIIYIYNLGDVNVDDLIVSDRIQIERKQFYFDLKENTRGRFLRITEDVGGRRDSIVIPSTGLKEFAEVLNRAIKISEETCVAVSAE